MKRNLLSIFILALLIVNIVLTTMTMITINNTSSKTAALVNDIAGVLDLEVNGPVTNYEQAETSVAIENTEVFSVEDSLTIPLKTGDDGVIHYCVVSVSLSMDTENKDYATYGTDGMEANEELIKSEIVEAFSSYTMDEVKADPEIIRSDILERIQKLFNSTFVYKVSFGEIMYQ